MVFINLANKRNKKLKRKNLEDIKNNLKPKISNKNEKLDNQDSNFLDDYSENDMFADDYMIPTPEEGNLPKILAELSVSFIQKLFFNKKCFRTS